MMKIQTAIVSYLETYAQPQRWQVIDDYLYDAGYREYSEDDAKALVEDGKITRVEDGVGTGGDPLVHYAPLNFDPNAESPNATARLRY